MKINKAFNALSSEKQKYVKRVINMPKWSKVELRELGYRMRKDVERDLKLRAVFREMYCR